MQPSPPPSLFQHLKTCELEPATVSHGVPWRTQNFCIKTQVKTYLYGTGILSSSALGCSMCLTSYCNNTVTRKDKFKSTELKFLVLLVWSVLKKKKKKLGKLPPLLEVLLFQPLRRVEDQFISSPMCLILELSYILRTVQTTKQVFSH